MTLKIKKAPPRTTNGLTFAELGLLTYMLGNTDSQGNFQQNLAITAEAGGIARSTVHLWQAQLIKKGAVNIIRKSRRGADGYQIPPVLAPNRELVRDLFTEPTPKRVYEQVQPVDNKEDEPVHEPRKPVHKGTLPPITNVVSGVLSDCDVENSDTEADGKNLQNRFDATPFLKKPPTAELYRPGEKIPSAIFDRNRLPWCMECHLVTVDYFPYQGTVDLDKFCTEDCHESWMEREAAGEAETRGETR